MYTININYHNRIFRSPCFIVPPEIVPEYLLPDYLPSVECTFVAFCFDENGTKRVVTEVELSSLLTAEGGALTNAQRKTSRMQSDNIKAAEIFSYLYEKELIQEDEVQRNHFIFISHYLIHDYTPRNCIRENVWFQHFNLDDIKSFEYQTEPILSLLKHLVGDNMKYIETVANKCHVRMNILETIPATNIFEMLIQSLIPHARIIFWEEIFVERQFYLLKVSSSSNIYVNDNFDDCWSPEVVHIISFRKEFGRRIAYKERYDLNTVIDPQIMGIQTTTENNERDCDDIKTDSEINCKINTTLLTDFISEKEIDDKKLVDSSNNSTVCTDFENSSVITDTSSLCSVDDKYYGFARNLDNIPIVGSHLSLDNDIRQTLMHHIYEKLSQKKNTMFFPKYGKIYEIIQHKKNVHLCDDDITDDTICEVVKIEHPDNCPDWYLFDVHEKLFTHQLVTIAKSDSRKFRILSNEILQSLISKAMIFVEDKYRFSLRTSETDLNFTKIDGYEYEDPKKMLPRLTYRYGINGLCDCKFRCDDTCRNRQLFIFCDSSICSIQKSTGLEDCGNHIIYCNNSIKIVDIHDPRMGTGLTNIDDFENERTVCGIYGGVVIDTFKETKLDDYRYEKGETNFYTLSLISEHNSKKKNLDYL